MFRVSGTATPANLGHGFLVDKVRLRSSNPPASRADCKGDGWKIHTRDDGSPFNSKRDCLKYVKHHARDRGHDRFHRGDRHHRRSPH